MPDERPEILRTRYDWGTRSPTTAVIETVSDATGCAPTNLEPLYDSLDPDALDALFRTTQGPQSSADIQVSFRYHGQDVTIQHNGEVVVKRDGTEPRER